MNKYKLTYPTCDNSTIDVILTEVDLVDRHFPEWCILVSIERDVPISSLNTDDFLADFKDYLIEGEVC